LIAALLVLVGVQLVLATSSFSGSVTSEFAYGEFLDGPVEVEIIHPTRAKCIKAFSNDVGYP
jgi:hypothetical protein